MSESFQEPRFEWDPNKEQENREKHGFGFELAQTVFEDPDLLLEKDRMEEGEQRWHALGLAAGQLLLLVVHVVRYEDGQEIIRIISARLAEKWERAAYRSVNTQGW